MFLFLGWDGGVCGMEMNKKSWRSFFSAEPIFFREAAFFSGGEGCEWRAQRVTVGESGDKTENAFSGLIPLAVPRKGFSPHIPASRLFILFHPSKAPSTQSHHTTINQNEFVKWGQSQRFFSPFFYTFVTPFVCIFTELFILLSHKTPNEVRPLI